MKDSYSGSHMYLRGIFGASTRSQFGTEFYDQTGILDQMLFEPPHDKTNKMTVPPVKT